MRRYRGENLRHRRPFWLPASNYYIFALAAAASFFFLLWGIFQEGGDRSPLVGAAVGAGVVFMFGVVMREVVMRNARNRFFSKQRSLDRSLKSVGRKPSGASEHAKLTLERNAQILREIAKKSEAAKVLGKFAQGHREVFELCEEYMAAVSRELPTVNASSPRLAALTRGNRTAAEYHHYHLLRWAEFEAKALTQEAAKSVTIDEKLEVAREALRVVGFALKQYPHETSLLESEKVLNELVTSITVSDFVERAERAKVRGNHKRAVSLYKDALFYLNCGEDGVGTAEAAKSIIAEIDRLLTLPSTD